MTEISKAAKAKACELANAVDGHPTWEPRHCDLPDLVLNPFARFIQQVSDAAKKVTQEGTAEWVRVEFARFILPEPVDTLASLVDGMLMHGTIKTEADIVEGLRTELAKRRLKIVDADAPNPLGQPPSVETEQ